MIKKTITFEDLDGRQRTEDFYFNLTKAELLEIQFNKAGGFAETLEAVVNAKNAKEVLGLIKTIVLKSYGVRDFENGHFIKTPELAEAFSHTEAYSELLFEMLNNELAAAAFVNGLMPAGLRDEVEKAQRAQPQDRLQKQPAHKEVVVDVQTPSEPTFKPVQVPTGPTMSIESFQALDAESASKFIADGGNIIRVNTPNLPPQE